MLERQVLARLSLTPQPKIKLYGRTLINCWKRQVRSLLGREHNGSFISFTVVVYDRYVVNRRSVLRAYSGQGGADPRLSVASKIGIDHPIRTNEDGDYTIPWLPPVCRFLFVVIKHQERETAEN